MKKNNSKQSKSPKNKKPPFSGVLKGNKFKVKNEEVFKNNLTGINRKNDNNDIKESLNIIHNNNSTKSSKPKELNVKRSQPFTISFGQKKLVGNNKTNEINLNNIKQQQSGIFAHQSPLRYNRPFKDKYSNFHPNTHNNKNNIYSVFIKNNLDSSQLYDLHKANWDVSKANKPTAKLRAIKLGDPFAVGNKHKTNFGYVYSAGGIPCRIEHGNVNMKLLWSIPPESLDYDPTLIICFEGLLETVHPYSFAAKQCVRELLTAKGAGEKVLPILNRLIPPLKDALVNDNPETFTEALNVVEILSDLVKENLNQYLHFFLQSINKRSFNLLYKERVFDLMRILEENGGPDALKEIKKKVPTYMSVL